jgi:hypothetical protein
MTRRTGNEGLRTRIVRDKRDAATLRDVAAQIRDARQPALSTTEAMRLADLARESGWTGAREVQAELARLRTLLARCASALEAVPDPSVRDLALIAEARGSCDCHHCDLIDGAPVPCERKTGGL